MARSASISTAFPADWRMYSDPAERHKGYRLIPLPRSAPNGEIIVPVEAALDFAPQARKRRHVYEPLRAPLEDDAKEST
jgi:hypothetical protein